MFEGSKRFLTNVVALLLAAGVPAMNGLNPMFASNMKNGFFLHETRKNGFLQVTNFSIEKSCGRLFGKKKTTIMILHDTVKCQNETFIG